MNNEPDYNESLVFEPKMTWDEFVKKYGDEDDNDMLIKKII